MAGSAIIREWKEGERGRYGLWYGAKRTAGSEEEWRALPTPTSVDVRRRSRTLAIGLALQAFSTLANGGKKTV